MRGTKEPYNPVSLNAKTGFVFGNECTTCWAFITNERTENHAKWHERQENTTTTEGESNASQAVTGFDKIAEARAEVERIESQRRASERPRRDPRNARAKDPQGN